MYISYKRVGPSSNDFSPWIGINTNAIVTIRPPLENELDSSKYAVTTVDGYTHYIYSISDNRNAIDILNQLLDNEID